MGRDSSTHACFLPPIRDHQMTALSQGLLNVLRNQVTRQKFGANDLFDLARSDFPSIREDILRMACVIAIDAVDVIASPIDPGHGIGHIWKR